MELNLVHTKKDIKGLNNMDLIANLEVVVTEMTKSINFEGRASKAEQRKYDYILDELSSRLDFSVNEYRKFDFLKST